VNEPIKILFDENFGEPLVTALADFLDRYDGDVDIKHIFKFVKPSAKDENWVPKIAAGGWTVISTDRGRRCGGQRLPDICREYGVTHILLSSSLHQGKQFEKVRAVVAVWPRIIMATLSPKGSRFSLRYDNSDKRIALVERPYSDRQVVHRDVLGFDGRKIKRQGSPKRKKPKDVIGQMKMGWPNDGK
jgi:hypothetical protein